MRGLSLLIMIAVAAGAPVAIRAAAGDAASGDVPAQAPAPDLRDWTRSLAPGIAPAQPATADAAPAPALEIDVVDAHWMALTMWGEARGGGETAMRAVGHVIDNRRRAGMHGAYATDQVGEAFQFSCWNPGDPNRAAILSIDSLAPDSRDHAMWRAARAIADEILAGRSADPTGGALFYHTDAVAPAWSAGVPPVRRIGTHLFFRTAR